ncbi:MAG: DolP-mannose mannosyltransferase [Acidobacteriota bacterium]
MVAIENASVRNSAASGLAAGLTRRRLFWIVLVVSALAYAQTEFWKQASSGDRANWDYFAQVISRGGVPYRDVVNIKSPLSAYIGAAAIVVTRPFGLRDVFAIRVAFVLLAALTVAFTFLVALDYLGSRRVAFLASMIMLSFGAFARLNGGGVQPKTPMVLFGLVTLWAILKDRPFTAGVFGMLSALSWQPGLLFVGAAGLAFSSYLTSWRDLKVVRLLAGAAIPLAIQLGYFWAAGALNDFYLWNIHFNATVYGPGQARSMSGFIHRIAKMMSGTYHTARFFFCLAAPGFAIAVWQALKRAKQGGARGLLKDAPRHAIIIAPSVYFLFCMIDIQGGADLIPLLPFVAVFAALALVFAVEQAVRLARKWRPGLDRWPLETAGTALLLLFAFVFSLGEMLATAREFPTLSDQDAEVREIVSYLSPGDKIFVHGNAEILVLSGLTNASKYFLLDRGKDGYLDQVEQGGFKGWLDRLKSEQPKVVALDRLKSLTYGRELREWVETDYDEHQGRIFTFYVRKESPR